jgi:hypothetical protein
LHDYGIQIRGKNATAEDTFTDPPEELQDKDYDIYNPMESEAEMPEANAFTPEMFDNLISAEVLIPKGDVLLPTTVIGCKQHEPENSHV